ncbi:MAG: cobalamin-binding protein [Gammaproteobacteria bacterium]|jgi:iron complex transport system substrate-binding protein
MIARTLFRCFPLQALSAAGFLVLLVGFLSRYAFATTLEQVDDRGSVISLSAPPVRVVSLAPHLTEILFDIGAGQRLVGVMAFSDFPEQAKALPRVGNHSHLNFEQILSLQPDLILGWRGGNRESDLKVLRDFGLKVFETDPRTLEDVAALMRRLGMILGVPEAAEDRARHFEEAVMRLRKTRSNRRPLRVFYQVWDQPIYTLNGDHVVTQMIEGCGGTNVFSALDALSPVVSIEAVLDTNPEVILGPRESDQSASWMTRWESWPQVKAVANKQVHSIPADLVARMGPRLVDAMAAICGSLSTARSQYDG